MKVLVCGDRNWTNKERILKALSELEDVKLVIQGGNGYFENSYGTERPCLTEAHLIKARRGADALAYQAALSLGLEVVTEWANWKQHKRRAGPIRNSLMLAKYQPDLVLAFHPDIDRSKGTKDCVWKAETLLIPVEIISS